MGKARPLRHTLALRFALVATLPFLAMGLLGLAWLVPQAGSEIEARHREPAGVIAAQVESYLTTSSVAVAAVARLAASRPVGEDRPLGEVLDAEVGAAEALGQHARLIVPKELHVYVDGVWSEIVSRTGGRHSTNDNVAKDGRRITCGWFNTPILSPSGRVVSVSSTTEDVTDRIRMENAIRESEAQLTAFLQLAPDPIAVVSALDGRFVLVNEAWQRALGYPVDDPLGRRALEVGPWRDPDEREAVVAVLMKEGTVRDRELRFRAADGREVLFETSARLIEKERNPYVVWMLRDVTERRRIEREIRELNATLERRVTERTAALERANAQLSGAIETLERAQDDLVQSEKLAALGRLVAGVAHELKPRWATASWPRARCRTRLPISAGSIRRDSGARPSSSSSTVPLRGWTSSCATWSAPPSWSPASSRWPWTRPARSAGSSTFPRWSRRSC